MKRFWLSSLRHSRESGNVDSRLKCLGILIFFLTLTTLVSFPVLAQNTTKPSIKIGEIYAYSALPDISQLWRNGWHLALDEINKSGGVMGRPLEVISRDDKANPAETIKILEEYKNREGIKIFFGTLHSHTSLAASAFAKQNQMLMIKGQGGSNKLTGVAGHDLFFQIEPPGNVWAGVLAEKAAITGKKRWAFVAADYEFGRSITEDFQKAIKLLTPDAEFMDTQWFPIGKLDAGAVTQAVEHSKPDGIFYLGWGSDYLRFVREGRKRNLFDNRLVVGPFAGYAGYIEPLGKEAPVGWLSADGYPAEIISGDEQKTFNENYKKRYGAFPDVASFYGYSALKILAESINTAGSDNPINVAEVIRQKEFKLPGGNITFRADGISNFGEWVGITGFKNGTPTMLNPEYVKSEKYLPPVEDNLKSRAEKTP